MRYRMTTDDNPPAEASSQAALRRRVQGASGPGEKSDALKALGLASLYAPPAHYTQPDTTQAGPGVAFVPSSPLEESLLCLLLTVELSPEVLKTDPSLIWHLALALGVSGHSKFLATFLGRNYLGEGSNYDVWVVKAAALEGSGQHEKALQSMRNLVKLHAEDPRLLLQCAKLCQQLEVDPDETISYARRALACTDIPPGLKRTGHVVMGLAYELRAQRCGDDLSSALAELQVAADLDPLDYRILYQLGRLKAISCVPPEEVAHIAKQALEVGGATYGPIWMLLAVARASQKETNKAVLVLDTGVREAGPAHTSQLLRAKTRILLAAEEASKALEALQQLMAHVQRGTAHTEAMDDVARDALNKEEAAMWILGVHVFLALKQPTDAQFCVDRVLSLQPYSADSHFVAGLLQEEADPAAALKSFETAMAIDPRHSDAEIHCGALYRRRASPGDLTIARSLLSSGLKHKPNSLVGWYNLGLIDRDEGRLEESEEDLRTAATLQETNPDLSCILPRVLP